MIDPADMTTTEIRRERQELLTGDFILSPLQWRRLDELNDELYIRTAPQYPPELGDTP